MNTSALIWIFATTGDCFEPFEAGWARFGHFAYSDTSKTALDTFDPPPTISVIRYAGIDDIPGMIKFLPVAAGGVEIQLTNAMSASKIDPRTARNWMLQAGVGGVLLPNAFYVVAGNLIDYPVCPTYSDQAFGTFTFTDSCVDYGGITRDPATITGPPTTRTDCKINKIGILIAVVLISTLAACSILACIIRDLRKPVPVNVPPPYAPWEPPTPDPE